MKKEQVIVSNAIEKEHSLAHLVQIACKYDSRISIAYDNKTLNAKSIIGVMSLNPQVGSALIITAEGADEEEAIRDIIAYLQ